MTLFGIQLERLVRKDPKRALLALLALETSSQVVTLNPEMALSARTDVRLRQVINNANLILADGVGIASFVNAERLTGADALELLLSEKRRIAFVGGAQGEAEAAAEAMRLRYPGIEILVDGAGDVQEGQDDWKQDPALLVRIQAYRPDVLAVALGHGKQEKWIAGHLSQLPSVRVAIGVGGTFAFLSGRIPRAPGWMRSIGLEWVWRLVREPSRIGRIFQAIVVFPILVVWDMISPEKTV